MALETPQATDFLNAPSHSRLHRVFNVDGAANDSSVYVDGSSDLIVANNLAAAGQGTFGKIRANNKLFFTQSDENEYIDSLNDGDLDLEATTAINLRINGTEEFELTATQLDLKTNDLTTTGDATAENFNVGTSIISQLNVNTYLNFLTTGYRFIADGVVFLRLIKGKANTILFNESNIDADFLYEGMNDINLLRCDASTDRIGIGVSNPQEKLSVNGKIVLPKASGNGIKVELATPTFGWRDLLGEVFARNTGASKPTFTTYRDTLMDFQFAAGDEEYFKFHIPHDYVKGTDIFIHIHWSHTNAFVTGGTITFTIESSYAKGHQQAPFPASVSGTYNGTASTTQYQHVISETALSDSSPTGLQIDTDDLEPDGVIMMRAEMTTNSITVSEGAVPDPFIHYVDIHYQSTNIGTKDKVPDFYA